MAFGTNGRTNNQNVDNYGFEKGFIIRAPILWAMGIVGGIGYSIYGGAWPIAVGVAVAAWLSWPKVTELFHNLTD